MRKVAAEKKREKEADKAAKAKILARKYCHFYFHLLYVFNIIVENFNFF